MAERSTPYRLTSVEEYLALEEVAEVRHEYVAGVVHAMVGATKRHNRIAGNIYRRLADAASGGPCRVYMESVKLRVNEETLYYPDVMVACGPENDDPLIEDAPSFIVEVASPLTEAIDRREKMVAYRRIPTLEAYFIVSQEDRRVKRHWRDAGGEWFVSETTDDAAISIPGSKTSLTLADVYEGL